MRGLLFGVALVLTSSAAAAEPACPGKPDALGVSRELVVSPSEYFLLGRMQYRQTLPLNDREVVLTFDDGPLPPYSDRVLDILAKECVKATFFVVGRMARANPAVVRRIYNAGHTVGTHSQNHPIRFDRISGARIGDEIDDGIASVAAALGDAKALAPYFRIPGIGPHAGRRGAFEGALAGGVEFGHPRRRLAQDQRQSGAASRSVAPGAEGQRRTAVARHPAAHGAGAAGSAHRAEAAWLQDRACGSRGRASGVAGEANGGLGVQGGLAACSAGSAHDDGFVGGVAACCRAYRRASRRCGADCRRDIERRNSLAAAASDPLCGGQTAVQAAAIVAARDIHGAQ